MQHKQLNLGFTSNYIHPPDVIYLVSFQQRSCTSAALECHPREVGGQWLHFEDLYIHQLFCSSLLKTQYSLYLSHSIVKV